MQVEIQQLRAALDRAQREAGRGSRPAAQAIAEARKSRDLTKLRSFLESSARNLRDRVVEARREFLEVARELAGVLSLSGETLAAGQWCESILDVAPQDWVANAILGDLAVTGGDSTRALKHFEQAHAGLASSHGGKPRGP